MYHRLHDRALVVWRLLDDPEIRPGRAAREVNLIRDPADEASMMHAARAPSGAVVAAVGLALATLVAPSARVSETVVAAVPVAAAIAIVVGV